MSHEDDHHSAVPIGIPTYASRDEMYKRAYDDIAALMDAPLEAQGSLSDWRLFARLTTSLSNICSVLFYAMNAEQTQSRDAPLHSLPINWAGFYLLDRPDRLALASFQGKVACQHIKLGKGMCGLAALQGKDVCIEDVRKDPRHIACDAASKSEAVIVLRDPSKRVVGVLDIDSAVEGRFTEADVAPLRRICDLITEKHGVELLALFRGATGGAPSLTSATTATNAMSAAAMPTPIPIFAIPGAQRMTPGGLAAVRIERQQQQDGSSHLVATSINANANHPTTAAAVITREPRVMVGRASGGGGAGGDNNSGSSRNEIGDLKKHRDWELRYRCVNEMLNSAALGLLEERLHVKLLPEIVFDMNEIHFVMDEGAGVKPLKFRVCAQTSLANVVKYAKSAEYKEFEKDALFPRESAAWEAKRKELATFDPGVDWAFRNSYSGVWTDGAGNEILPCRAEGEHAAPDDRIDYDMLRCTDLPILFFSSIDLWEDDLHDSGISKLVAKARVMEPCFFVLVRHILRVDGVRMQVRDTRHFHKFGSRKVVIEESLKGLNIQAYLKEQGGAISEEEFHRTLMTSQPEQLDMLKEEWRKNWVIAF